MNAMRTPAQPPHEPVQPVFPAQWRPFVMALGQVMMPPVGGMPGFDLHSLARFENQLSAHGKSIIDNFLWALRLLRLRARIFSDVLGPSEKERIDNALKGFASGSTIERQIYKSLGMLVKISHFDCEEVYQAVGVDYVRTQIATDETKQLQGQLTLEDLQALSEAELDAVVVGTGAGGAVIAYELAQAGFVVLLVEEGEYHGRKTFNRSTNTTRKLYRNGGLTVTLGNPPIYLPVGRSVGGTTTINSGTCYRPPERVFAKWHERGLTGWSSARLSPFYDRVEKTLQVAQARPPFLGGCADVIALGCERMGYKHNPLLRNAPNCDGQGVCAFGCPTDARRSTNVSYVPMALRAGAYLSAGTSFISTETHGSKVHKINLLHKETKTPIQIGCKLLVLSTGSLRTPLYLKKMGLRNRHLGRNLTIHPVASVLAEFGHSIRGDLAIPQGYAIEEFHNQGLLFEGGFIPLELLAGSTYLHGAKLQHLMAGYRQLANFGFMVEDEGRGRILGEYGDFPLVHYSLSPRVIKKLQKGIELLAGIFFAAGAKRVWPQLQDDITLRSWEDLRTFAAYPTQPSKLELSAYHPLGTARLGASSDHGVVDPTGRVYGMDNVYVVDGSIIPTSPAVNPQLTIMAAASYIASLLPSQARRLNIQL